MAGEGASGPAPIVVGEEVVAHYASPQHQAVVSSAEPQRVWSREITYEGATYICPHIEKIDLPEGAYLLIRSPDGSRSWKYSGRGKNVGGKIYASFWGIHIHGPTAIVELYSPTSVPADAVVIDRYARGRENFNDVFQADVGIEALCGKDDSKEAKCYQTQESAVYDESRAVARLLLNGSGACTGWLVGSAGDLLTNEHCIGSATVAANTNFEFMGEGATCSAGCADWGACPGTVVATSATAVKIDAELDYALVKLPTNPTDTYGYMQLRQTGAVVGERIYIPQHPQHWGKRIAMESTASENASGYCEVFSVSEAACSDATSYNDVGYYCDTQGGSSGSPVLSYPGTGDGLVVALHHCANCPNRGVPIQHVISDLGPLLPPDALPEGSDIEPPSVSLDEPADGATLVESVILGASASDNVGIKKVDFLLDGIVIGSDSSSPYGYTWDSTTTTNGRHTMAAKAYDTSFRSSTHTISVTVANQGGAEQAVFDTTLRVPVCTVVGNACDSGTLLDGRGSVGPEPNMPNTLYDSCADGNAGRYHNDESIDKVRIYTHSGNLLAEGEQVTVEVTTWVWAVGSDHLDLYYTADANSNPPTWNYIDTVEPTTSGLETLSASYTLPSGSLQAVRANFRYDGSVSSCSTDSYDDHDDLAFAVEGGEGGCTTIYSADFESDAHGWSHSARDSTCTAGGWTVGDPDGVENGGVVTQVEDDQTAAPGVNAFFTAPNTGGAEVDDVDGGVCTAYSPIIDARAYPRVDLTFWYYHGQRNEGDDASGDFFTVDLSTDGGRTFSDNLVSFGDVTSNAQWTQVNMVVDSPGQMMLRLRASDGSSAEDLVEGGIDDVVICVPERSSLHTTFRSETTRVP
jgi:hypothetical protein